MESKRAQTFVIGNFKGGVGKSTTVQMVGFESAAVKERKTLIIDLDPQGNTSDVMQLTAENFQEEGIEFSKTIWDAVQGAPIDECIYPIMPNLDLIPANILFSEFPDYLIQRFEGNKLEQFKYFAGLIEPLKEIYDVIYIDVPPTISTYSNCAMYAAEYVIIILQTQVKSLKGAQSYIDYMNFFVETYDTDLEIVGIIPFMMQKRDAVDQEVYQQAKELYGYHLLNTVVLNQSRLKRYDGTGITLDVYKNGNLDIWDAKAHAVFIDILNELDNHIEWLNGDQAETE
ncbi:ParA family protein [Enterococcus mediterraneensis]|uniref:ParA family protein n=1 Tax=Enterococcus mediterraneensis TaxID=2364791 RepID=UPI000F06061D|nr:ParA family protein [Enterococcus mediterraneensis]